MKIISCDNSWQNKWDEFIKNNSLDFGLLQAWPWGEFQKKLNKKVWRLAIEDGGEILAAAQIIKQPLKLGKSYFYLPRGPVLNLKAKELRAALAPLWSKIKNLAQKEGAIFIRLDPAWEKDPADFLINQKSVGQVQPQQTLILDLTKSADELLAQMKPKTRYNIKVAQKHDIVIDRGEKYFADFWRLTKQTAKRQEIVAYDQNYYQTMLAVLGQQNILELWVAKAGEQVVAANFLIFFGDCAVYLFGASDYRYRQQMAPQLLQWQVILAAQKRGLKFYDFWGVDENKWPGISRFKQGFAPARKLTRYVGAHDEIINNFWYNIYRLIKK